MSRIKNRRFFVSCARGRTFLTTIVNEINAAIKVDLKG